MRLLELGNLVKARLSVRDAALMPMRELHRLTGQTVNLSVVRATKSYYIERATRSAPACRCRAIGWPWPLQSASVASSFSPPTSDPRARLRDAHRACRAHAEQHHRFASSSAN